jgi:hypothetical protein
MGNNKWLNKWLYGGYSGEISGQENTLQAVID